MTYREVMMWIHGIGLGSVFLLAFTAIAVGLNSLRSDWITTESVLSSMKKIKISLWVMAVIAWSTVLTGLLIIYPWYLSKPLDATGDLSLYPRSFLLSNAATVQWHDFGMAWKEHIALITPVAATVVAYVVQVYGEELLDLPRVRMALLEFFSIALGTAVIAGVLGALITRVIPIH